MQSLDWKLITEILIDASSHVTGLENNSEIMALKGHMVIRASQHILYCSLCQTLYRSWDAGPLPFNGIKGNSVLEMCRDQTLRLKINHILEC